LYHTLIGDRDFDLREATTQFESDHPGVLDGNDSPKRGLFVLWYISEPETRNPKEFKDVAETLGLSTATLRFWMQQKWFFAEIHKKEKDLLVLLAPHIFKQIAIRALHGERGAMRDFAAIFTKLDSGEKKRESLFDGVGSGFMSTARRIVGDTPAPLVDRSVRDQAVLELSLFSDAAPGGDD
jgi:hypothetical protein